MNFRDSRDGCIGAVHFVDQDHSQGVILQAASAVQTNELGTQILEPLVTGHAVTALSYGPVDRMEVTIVPSNRVQLGEAGSVK